MENRLIDNRATRLVRLLFNKAMARRAAHFSTIRSLMWMLSKSVAGLYGGIAYFEKDTLLWPVLNSR